MANPKEDEKNERTIRSLLKLPDNRRCINCNNLVVRDKRTGKSRMQKS